MNQRDIIQAHEIEDSGSTCFLPVCFCLDTSKSMEKKDGGTDRLTNERIGPSRIALLQEGMKTFLEAIGKDLTTRYMVEVAIVTFDDTARLMRNFTLVERALFDSSGRFVRSVAAEFPKLETNGKQTAMGEGVCLALDMLQKCKEDYSEYGVEYYQPWLVLISDGGDNGSPLKFREAKQRIHDLVRQDKLTVYPIAVGSEKSRECLNELSPVNKAINLNSVDLPSLFRFLSQSAATVTHSHGERKPLELGTFKRIGWSQDLNTFA